MEQRWLQRFRRKHARVESSAGDAAGGGDEAREQHGSAPGIWLEDEHGRWVAMLPGVPREMKGMLADTLLPRLSERASAAGAPTVVRSRTLRTTGVAESLLADQIDPMREQLGPITLAYLPAADGVDLRLTIRGVSSDGADETLEQSCRIDTR